MPELATLDWKAIRQAIVIYRDLLVRHRDYLNRINVYPVSDRDTGTNMERTMQSVARAIESVTSMEDLWAGVRKGSLAGAQGTSGVVLAQMATSVAGVCGSETEVSSEAVAQALDVAQQAGYSAVVQPVEGTILTVAREAAAAATETRARSLVEVLDTARTAAARALDATPGQLPTLERAGVVDAGGAGLVLLLDSLLHVAADRPLPEPPADPEVREAEAQQTHGPRFEVVVRLILETEALEGFRRRWAQLGDEATVITKSDELWVAHIHTDHPDAAIEAARSAGTIDDYRVVELPT